MEVILQPLGLGATAKSATESCDVLQPGSTGIRPRVHVMRPLNLSCYAGSMAFFSTPSDLVRFALSINSDRLLQPATVQLLQTSQQLTSGRDTGHGLGWDLKTVTLAGEPAQAVGDDGESFGQDGDVVADVRERGIVVAVMSNISHADTSALALKVAEAFAEQSR